MEQWRKQLQTIRGIFQNFRLSYVRQIETIGKTDDETNPPRGGDSGRFFKDANIHGGVDGGATVAFVSEVKRCHCFPLYCLKLAKYIFN